MARRRGGRRYQFRGTLYFGGSCRPNPGRASIGFVIHDDRDDRVVEEFRAYLGFFPITSNGAHYKALIAGLQHALWRGITHITARGHSLLICNQVTGEYRVDSPWLKRYCDRVWELSSQFESFEVEHIYFEDNSEARSLAREGFYNTIIDRSSRVEREILQGCSDPESAREYILKERCDGYHSIQFILDTIQDRLPNSYAVAQEICSDISNEMGRICKLQNNKSMAALLAIS